MDLILQFSLKQTLGAHIYFLGLSFESCENGTELAKDTIHMNIYPTETRKVVDKNAEFQEITVLVKFFLFQTCRLLRCCEIMVRV